MTIKRRTLERTNAKGRLVTRTTWRVRVADPDHPGKTLESSHRTKADAEAEETRLKALIAGKQHISKAKRSTLVRDVAKSWEATWHVKPLSPLTIRDYSNILAVHVLPRFGDEPVSAITAKALQDWVAELADDKSAETVGHIYNAMRSILRVAEQHGLINANPASKASIILPSKKVARATAHEQLALTAAQLQTLAEAQPTAQDTIMVWTAGLLGLRAGEQHALRRKDIDTATNRVHVRFALKEVSGHLVAGPTKTAERRSLSIPKRLREPLATLASAPGVRVRPVRRVADAKDARDLNDIPGGYPMISDAGVFGWTDDATDEHILIFRTRSGAPIRQNNHYSKVFKPVVKALWPAPDPLHRLRWHDLRHTNASLLAKQTGGNLSIVQKRLGHSSITVTIDRYSHLLPNDDEDISDALGAMFDGDGADDIGEAL